MIKFARMWKSLCLALLVVGAGIIFSTAKEKQAQQSSQPVQVAPPTLHKITQDGIHFYLVEFDATHYELSVVDQLKGPGSEFHSSKQVGLNKKALAVINAGFFTPEGKPLGVLAVAGKKRGVYNTSSLGGGIYYTTQQGANITRSSHWKNLAKSLPQYLLQAGPMLVDQSKSTVGLSTKKIKTRSFIASDGKNRFIIGYASPCTLNQLGAMLAKGNWCGFKIQTAMNLDGGRSSDLWVSPQVTNSGKHGTEVRGFFNKSVRNFLVLKKK